VLAAAIPQDTEAPQAHAEPGLCSSAESPEATSASERIEVYGDSSYGTGEVLAHLEAEGAIANVKVQPPSAPKGRFPKDAFDIDLANHTVTCPSGQLVRLRTHKDGSGLAEFGQACKQCPMRQACTDAKEGRNIIVHKHERLLKQARDEQKSPAWRANYRATRPKVERKLAHLMRRRHGGRRARVRGTIRVAHDFALLCAAANLNRLAALGWHHVPGTLGASA
jgi:DDE family transposase